MCAAAKSAPAPSATSGYSGTALAKKLGIKPGHRVGLISAPQDAEELLAPLPENVKLTRRAQGRFDVIVFFSKQLRELDRRFGTLASKLRPNGRFWIGWPKKSSGVTTNLNFDVVQRLGLASGLVDNKICAIDKTWSGLRFVYRLENRPEKTQ